MRAILCILAGLVLWGCQSGSVSNRETEVYQTLQAATKQQRLDFMYFLEKNKSDSLLTQANQLIKEKATKLDKIVTALKQELITKAGGGQNKQTGLPNKPYELKNSQRMLKARFDVVKNALISYNAFLKTTGRGIPLPDLKVYDQNMYVRYFKDARLIQCLFMLCQIRNDLWFNAHLLSQRLSY